MSSLTEQLQEKIAEHNELHQQIQQGKEQIGAMETQRERIFGQVQLLQELVQDEAGGAATLDGVPAADDE